MGESLKLSVIIPVYNVEQYLDACMKSIESSLEACEETEQIEVLFINDGSTDSCASIIKEYLQESKYQISYFEKTNGGLSDARNFGLNVSDGEYVTFIDSDDFISVDYFPVIMEALNHGKDLIFFDFYNYFFDESTPIYKAMNLKGHLWTIIPSAWNKVWKRSLLSRVEFPLGKVFEDVAFTYKMLGHVNEFIYLETPLYYYRKNRPGSIMTRSNQKEKMDHIYDILEEIYDYHQQNDFHQQSTVGIEYQFVRLLLWSNMYRQLQIYKFNLIDFHHEMRKCKRIIEEKYPDWMGNELLLADKEFFISRLGENYLKILSNLGENLFSTTASLFYILKLNYLRR